jgi:hypothetical protein
MNIQTSPLSASRHKDRDSAVSVLVLRGPPSAQPVLGMDRMNAVPIECSVDHARRLVVCVWVPPLAEDEIVAMIERAATEGLWTYGTLHDVRSIEPRGVGRAREMLQIVGRLSEVHGSRGPVAFVAAPAGVGSAQAYAILGGQSGQATQVFWEREAAEEWLSHHTAKPSD